MRKTHLKSNIILMEIIVCIVFFSLSAAICVKTFAFSYSLSKKSTDLGGSVLASQSMAEVYKSQVGNIEKVAEVYKSQAGNLEKSAGGLNQKNSLEELVLFYDENWYKADNNTAPNHVKLTKISDTEAKISAFNEKNEEIFSFDVCAGG